MPLKSMTGFARAEGAHGSTKWVWELRSVNGRGLDVRFRLPTGYESLEPRLREATAKVLTRGSFTAVLNISGERAVGEIRLNENALRQVAAAVTQARQIIYEAGPMSLEAMLSVKGVLEVHEADDIEGGNEEQSVALTASFANALNDLDTARQAEGARLQAVISEKLDEIAELTQEAEASESRTPQAIETRLKEQLQRLLSADAGLDPDRLHQEAVIIAAKADIEEELKRLRAHVAAAHDLLASDQPAGRKLEFLLQEFHREANTLCSKSNAIDITRIGLRMKTAIDRLREQAQNIE